ncbi:MAG: AAA family ATPase [Muribaculaceae bacterium]|nr:AAA family ATPase [Muribaculaceae bacterium]
MQLTKYKVLNFKSVKDSGWIDCNDVTTLVGVNEAGKSNLLLALWKLNPVTGGEIDVLHDAPVSNLTVIRTSTETVPFITASFDVSDSDMDSIIDELGFSITPIKGIDVTRYFDGHYEICYKDQFPEIIIEEEEVAEECDREEEVSDSEDEGEVALEKTTLDEVVVKLLPKFVYYSNYGNLSTRLYLPHVTKWLKGESVEGITKNQEQIRTIRVLFRFVNLQPEEIRDLGRDPKDMVAARHGYNMRGNYQPTADDIKKAQKAKEERTILLQSAGNKLTREFADWWKQGNYKFRFDADGDYFTIWVSDEKRPDEVGLELRSTGLQWFISFFLIFLVESKYKHKDAILLLDEAGLTLHPKAQKDLCIFFNSLAKNNQIIHTTHSPFIVDTNNIDRCKVVYVDSDGYTVASANLRDSDDKLNEQSIYALHAALGLSVSDILLQGCKPVIVEGPSDQIYLSAIKQALIGAKKIAPKEDLIFMPSGGVKGINGVVSLLGGKQGKLPLVVLDSDKSGQDAKKKLLSGLYQEDKKSLIEIGSFISVDNAEIEDLVPLRFLEKGINKLFNNIDDEEEQFEDVYDESKAITPQIEEFAKNNSIELPKGWKVDLAKTTKSQILKSKEIETETLTLWKKLFDSFQTKNIKK